MSEWMIFAERLSEQIKKQNLSIRQLAERMDMTPTTIFRYARGQRVPRANEILKASDVLGVTCDYLVGLSDDPKKTSRPTAQPDYQEVLGWLLAYHTMSFDFHGRYLPHEVISWLINDFTKEFIAERGQNG
jgi:transcriptional regulator with XRE-family HTH domain